MYLDLRIRWESLGWYSWSEERSPGQTRVSSTTIFVHVDVMEYDQAHMIAGLFVSRVVGHVHREPPISHP